MSDSERTASAHVALAGVVSGILGFTCAPGVGGILALVLGWTAHQELRPSSGAPVSRRAERLALGALGLGSANVVFVAVALSAAAFHEAPSPRAVAVEHTPTRDRGVAREPGASFTDRPSSPAPQQRSEAATQPSTRIGEIEVVDVATSVDSLSGELARQNRIARHAGSRLLLWVSAPDCAPCKGVASALSDRRMQRALEHTRVVRVNRDDFAPELEAIGIPYQAIPGFALLDAEIRPVDYLDGGEWDEDVPHNIAPVLAGFMRGNYNMRRRAWHGATRRKITAL